MEAPLLHFVALSIFPILAYPREHVSFVSAFPQKGSYDMWTSSLTAPAASCQSEQIPETNIKFQNRFYHKFSHSALTMSNHPEIKTRTELSPVGFSEEDKCINEVCKIFVIIEYLRLIPFYVHKSAEFVLFLSGQCWRPICCCNPSKESFISW